MNTYVITAKVSAKSYGAEMRNTRNKNIPYIYEIKKKFTEVVKKYFFLIGNGIKMFRSSAP